MVNGIKYVFNDNPFYVHFKKHFCPQCNTRLKPSYTSIIINAKSPEAKHYDFSLGDVYLVGNVDFRTRCFYCPTCQTKTPVWQIRAHEQAQKK